MGGHSPPFIGPYAWKQRAEVVSSSGFEAVIGNNIAEVEAIMGQSHCTGSDSTLDPLQVAVRRVSDFYQASDGCGLAEEMLRIAGIHLERNEVEQAAVAGRVAEKMFRGLRDRRREAAVLLDVVVPVELHRGEPKLALLAASSAAGLFRSEGDASGERAALELASAQHVAFHEPDDALELVDQAMSLAPGQRDLLEDARLLNIKANALAQKDNLSSAIDHTIQALNLCEESQIPEVRTCQQCTLLQTMSKLLVQVGAHAEACEAGSSAVFLSECPADEAPARRTLAQAALANGNAAQAMGEASQSRSIFQLLGDQLGEASAAFTAAQAMHESGNTTESLQLMKESAKLHWICNDVPGAARCLHAVVKMQVRSGSATRGRQAAEAAYLLAKAVGDSVTEATALRVLAWAHIREFSQVGAESVNIGAGEDQYGWEKALDHLDPMHTLPQTMLQAAGAAVASSRASRDKVGLAAALDLYSQASLTQAGAGARKALSAAKEAQSLYRHLAWKRAESAALLRAAVAHLDIDDDESARNATRAAAELIQERADSDDAIQRAVQTAVDALDGDGDVQPILLTALDQIDLTLSNPEHGFGGGVGHHPRRLGAENAAVDGNALDKAIVHQAKAALARVFERTKSPDPIPQAAQTGNSKSNGKPVPFANRESFPWQLHHQKPPSTTALTRADVPPADRPKTCRKCSSHAEDGAEGLNAYDGQWFCRGCWRVWVDARIRIYDAQQRREVFRCHAFHAQPDTNWSDDEGERRDEILVGGKGSVPTARPAFDMGSKGCGKARGDGPRVGVAESGGFRKGTGRKGSVDSRKCDVPTSANRLVPPSPLPVSQAVPSKLGPKVPAPRPNELADMSLLQLFTRAKSMDFSSNALGAAMDSDAPKLALTNLMLSGG